MYERDNILRIFKESKEAIAHGDSAKIKNLSNQTTNSASLTNDPDNIASAVMIYSLSKIIERPDYKRDSEWNKFYRLFLSSIDKIIIYLEKENDEKFREEIKKIRKYIEKLSGNLKEDIQQVFRKASINKASRIYAHGISMERTAKLLGISLFELASYAGERYGSSYEMKDVDVKERLKIVSEFFK